MKRSHSHKAVVREKIKKPHLSQTSPSLPLDIIENNIRKAIVESFKFDNNDPKSIDFTLKNIRAVNRSWKTYFDDHDTIRTIISNASSIPYYRGILAHSINLPSVKNYLEQSEELNLHIANLDDNQIKERIKNGADINYCEQFNGKIRFFPILLKTMEDYNKTKFLLDLGADQNIACTTLTPLSFALLNNKTKFVQLFIEYNPHNKHVKEAIQTDDINIVQLILQQKDISIEDIESAKAVAIRQKNSDVFITLLDEYVHTMLGYFPQNKALNNFNNTLLC